MAKKKKKKPTSKFEAVVRVTYGRGKKAVSVDVPVTVDFARMWYQTDPVGFVMDEMFMMDFKDKVLNAKELRAAHKAWLAHEEA